MEHNTVHIRISIQFNSCKALSTLTQKSETVARTWDCRRKVRQSHFCATVQSHFSATVWTGLKST